jgi:hypothetical protein
MLLTGIVACALASAVAAPPETPGSPSVPALPPPAAPAAARILGVDEPTTVTLDVGAWVPRITGTAKVGASGTKFELNHDLAIDDSVAAPAGELAVWFGRWRLGLTGFESSAGSTEAAGTAGTFGTTSIAVGDRITGSYSAWMIAAEAGYVVWRPFADQPFPWDAPGTNRARATADIGANGRPRFDARVLLLGGALLFDYQESLRNDTAGGSSEFSKFIGAVYGGVGVDLWMGMDGRIPLVQDIRIYANVGLGPSIPDADVVWMIRVGVCAMFTGNVGIECGYRLFDFNLQDGPSEVDGGLRGLFGAVTVKF